MDVLDDGGELRQYFLCDNWKSVQIKGKKTINMLTMNAKVNERNK